jgi:hypothetical protein
MLLKLHPIWKRNPTRSVRECQNHNRYSHGRLAASSSDFNRHMCRYVLNFTLPTDHAGFASPDEWAGVAENCFYSTHSFADAFAAPSYPKFQEDEVRFADLDNLILVPAVPSTIFGHHKNAPFKIFRVNWFAPDRDAGAALKMWEAEFARAVSLNERLKAVVTGYVQNRPIEISHSFPAAIRVGNTLDEFWIRSLNALPEFIEREAEIRQAVGYDDAFDLRQRIQLLVESKLVWDLGEDPATSLVRLRRR